MCITKKPVNNCVKCGRFYSTEDSFPLCKECFDPLCDNCWEPHLIPSHLLDVIPHFCDHECHAHFIAEKEVENSVSQLIQSLDFLRKSNYNRHGKGSFKYYNKDFSYVNWSDSQETTFSLKVKHNALQDKRLILTHNPNG